MVVEKLQICENCKNFHQMNLECRKHAPVVRMCSEHSNVRTFAVHKSVFPKINKNDWCGEIELTLQTQEKIALICEEIAQINAKIVQE